MDQVLVTRTSESDPMLVRPRGAREDRGNVGIIRSPLRASILLDSH